MPPDPCSARIDQLIKRHLAPWLKAHGFSRQKLTWNRTVGDFVDVLDLQPSQSNAGDSCDITLNAGVFEPGIYETCWGRAPSGNSVKEADCIVGTRLGVLHEPDGPRQRDRWWTIGENVAEPAEDILAALPAALTYFDRLHSLEGIHAELAEDAAARTAMPASTLYLAIVSARLGNVDHARRLIDAFSDPRLRAWRDRARQVSLKLGIAE